MILFSPANAPPAPPAGRVRGAFLLIDGALLLPWQHQSTIHHAERNSEAARKRQRAAAPSRQARGSQGYGAGEGDCQWPR